MRVGIPIWDGRVSPVFDTARRLMLCDVAKGAAGERREEDLPPGMPQRRVARLKEVGTEVLICGAISRPLAGMIAATGVQVIPFVSGEVEDVLHAFSEARLGDPAFLMPGCRGRGRGRRFGGGRGRGRCG